MKRACVAMVSVAALACAACTSTQDVLDPSAIAATGQGFTASQPQFAASAPISASPAAEPAPTAAAMAPVTAKAGRIRLTPVVGAPVEASAPLTERLTEQARARGIQLAGDANAAPALVLKGYFSALTENGTTTVIYVWDVYDEAGARLHRITGQQSGPSGKQEGWSSVPPATMRTIADQTIDAFAAWAGGQSG
ncbi:MAG: hypothetical protein JNL61_01975 [Rhizobiaceae bacterium]|nr:hypothetical protein [Rhizobiaceae bacterium]